MGDIRDGMDRQQYGDTKTTHQVFKVELPDPLENIEASTYPKIRATLSREEFEQTIQNALIAINRYEKDRYVFMENRKVWFDRNVAALFPRFEAVELPCFEAKGRPLANFTGWPYEGFPFGTMTEKEARRSFTTTNAPDNPYLNPSGKFLDFPTQFNNAILVRGVTGEMCLESDGMVRRWGESIRITMVPIFRLGNIDAAKMRQGIAGRKWLIAGLIPENLGKYLPDYVFLMRIFPQVKSYLCGERHLEFKWDDFWQDVDDEKVDFSQLLEHRQGSMDPLAQADPVPQSDVQRARDYLCNCDHIRANLQPYDSKILTDINRGHWELFEPVHEDWESVVELPEGEPFYARPPQMDVNRNGIVAIDFGTKSTVVVRQIGTDERLMRVGQGDYTKALKKEDYENPTVVELRDYQAFHAAYQAREGRPFTAWEQARFSHEAGNVLKDAETDSSIDSSVFYSIFSELKQWANDKERCMKLKDKKGNVVDLQPYLKITEEDFDPIELYAYYLGLYINNMHNGICLEYMLSFPVTYEQAVREKILHSFEAGLKKSFPPAILQDEELMEDFRVYAGASEPAAYASCALGKLGLQPAPGQKTAYAVFDFGGGTTDFDFGVESVPENRRSKFVIDQFTSTGRGDPYLGGENLLHLLAYEVYKENLSEMQAKQIPFVLPYGGKFFAGAEPLVATTQNATQEGYVNTKRMMEMLRPYWEGRVEEAFFQDTVKITLNSNTQGEKADLALHIDETKLEDLLKQRIRSGIENFFEAQKGAFLGREVYPVHILLAGNSCKSKIVKELFEAKIEEEEQKIWDKIAENARIRKDTLKIFELHLPLGSEEEQVDSLPENDDEDGEDIKAEENRLALDFDQKATGKTGVAFGLLRSRIGGRDVRIKGETSEAPFPFYLGEINDEGKFHVKIGMDIPYKQWVSFTFADVERFEIYYTKEARAAGDDMDRSEVDLIRCKLKMKDIQDYMDDDDAHIFVRKISPDTIEYAAGKDSDFANDSFGGEIYKETIPY